MSVTSTTNAHTPLHLLAQMQQVDQTSSGSIFCVRQQLSIFVRSAIQDKFDVQRVLFCVCVITLKPVIKYKLYRFKII